MTFYLILASFGLQPTAADPPTDEVVTQATAYHARDGISARAEPSFELKFAPREDPTRTILRFESIQLSLEHAPGEDLRVNISGHGTSYRSVPTPFRPSEHGSEQEMDDSDLNAATLAATVLFAAFPEDLVLMVRGGKAILLSKLLGVAREVVKERNKYEEQAEGGVWHRGRLWIATAGGVKPVAYRPTRFQTIAGYLSLDVDAAKRPGPLMRFVTDELLGELVKIPLHEESRLVQLEAGEIATRLYNTPGSGGSPPTSYRDPLTGLSIPLLSGSSLTPSFYGAAIAPAPAIAPQVSAAHSIDSLLAAPAVPVATKTSLRAWQAAGVTTVSLTENEPNVVTITPNSISGAPPPRAEGRSPDTPRSVKVTVSGTPFGDFTFGR